MLKDINISLIHEYLTLLDDNTSDELSEIMSKHQSDKGYGLCNTFIEHNQQPPNGVCHNYTYFYNLLFVSYRDKPLTIFEMGVGVPPCMGSWAGSLKGWAEYFPNSTIFSADFDKNYLYEDERIKSFYVDQEDESSIISLWENLTQYTFDIIIDDGPHTQTSNYKFYTNSIHKLKSNGIYIIEDINLDFIDQLMTDIVGFNRLHNIDCHIEKLVIPWPKKFSHSSTGIMNMNNLLFIKKLH
jgi:hypothetical protein